MILIVFAHPYPRRSHANKSLIDVISKLEHVVIDDLYGKYPDFHIDVAAEQHLLSQANLIVFQFPLYWYNVPAMLKQWQEVVLTPGFGFGKQQNENALQGKPCMAVVTTGHKKHSYQNGGFDSFTLEDFLHPLEQLAHHCKMEYQPPLVVHQAHRVSSEELSQAAEKYVQRLQVLYTQTGAPND
ncbi:MAG: NAD(P)H-dependent oxidoreductase [Gammaproteobacteria bacterium]|nr:NAD(P)H-dependent oxidoreductase [Gammaproteobacteria bacterium]